MSGQPFPNAALVLQPPGYQPRWQLVLKDGGGWKLQVGIAAGHCGADVMGLGSRLEQWAGVADWNSRLE